MQHWFIMPFDHRGSFQRTFFGIEGREPLASERQQIIALKQVIYDGVLRAVALGVPFKDVAILVDEEFGAPVIADAARRGIPVALTTEQSGGNEFQFEHGDRWQEPLTRLTPRFAKVLMRYNPESDAGVNARQVARAKQLSDFCAEKPEMGLLFELLVPATKKQLAQVGGSVERYDEELRPALTEQAIRALSAAGVRPELWKLEGVQHRSAFAQIVAAAREADTKARVVILGRGKSETPVHEWIRKGALCDGVVGFAVGRTIFEEPLTAYMHGAPRADAVDVIARNYKAFCDLFTEQQGYR